MLRETPSTSAKKVKDYYLNSFSKGDYYSEGHEIRGQWGGKGAELLGLSGEVDEKGFMALCDNLNPTTGEQLTPRMKAYREIGRDFTFDVPKSVSVVHAISRDQRIVDAMEECATKTMVFIETQMRTRVRLNGIKDETRVTANLVWAGFTHFTTRPVNGIPDPHLHWHCFAFNCTMDPVEKRWKAGMFKPIVDRMPEFQAYYHNLLAQKLQQLGFRTELRGIAFEIVGVPDSVIETFSKRTKIIKKAQQDLGITDPKAKAKLGAATRESKNHNLSPNELRDHWMKSMTASELKAVQDVIRASHERIKTNALEVPSSLAATRMSGLGPNSKALTKEEELAIAYARLHCFEKASVVSESRFIAAVLQFGVGRVDFERVRASVAERSDLIRKQLDGRVMLTTQEVLDEEKTIVAWARAGKGTVPPLAPDYRVEAKWLTDEQRAAVEQILSSRDRIMGVLGRSGAGKTTLMKVAIGAMEERRHKVLVLTPRAQTAHETLAKEGFANTQTVAQLLENKTLQEKFHGGIYWVDEAGQLSARDMYRLVKVAEEQNARIIVSGDTRQHGPVERGDSLRILQEHAGLELVKIGKIQRQTGRYREAVEHLSEGRVEEALNILDSMGWICEISNEERHVQLAKDYLAALREGKTALVISPTHSECRRVTEQIRIERKNAEEIGEERVFSRLHQLNLSEAQRRDARTYRPGFIIEMIKSAPGLKSGDRLEVIGFNNDPQGGLEVRREDGGTLDLYVYEFGKRFQVYEKEGISIGVDEPLRITKNGWSADERYRLLNGGLRTVTGFTSSGDIELDNGVVISKNFAHFDYGYATTSHAAQGRTVDRVFIAESPESFCAASLEQAYVSISRGREIARMYTSDKLDLLDAVRETSQRMSALDIVDDERNRARDYEQELRRAQQRAEAVLPLEPPAENLRWKLGGEKQVPAMVRERVPQMTIAL